MAELAQKQFCASDRLKKSGGLLQNLGPFELNSLGNYSELSAANCSFYSIPCCVRVLGVEPRTFRVSKFEGLAQEVVDRFFENTKNYHTT
jgi:hypothetical protein